MRKFDFSDQSTWSEEERKFYRIGLSNCYSFDNADNDECLKRLQQLRSVISKDFLDYFYSSLANSNKDEEKDSFLGIF